MNETELRLIAGKFPLSPSTLRRNLDLRANDSGLRADDSKPAKGYPLVGPVSREEAGSTGSADGVKSPGRYRIRFTIYAVRPCDWDNWDIKYLQDLLVKAGVLASDDWASLQGEVISRKVHKKTEEKTVVEIEELP